MSTLFKKDSNNLGRVIDEINPENSWVFEDEGVLATRKFDGTSCAIIGGKLYKRYDVRVWTEEKANKKCPDCKGFGYYACTNSQSITCSTCVGKPKKQIPDGAIACTTFADIKSGHPPKI